MVSPNPNVNMNPEVETIAPPQLLQNIEEKKNTVSFVKSRSSVGTS